MKIVIFSEGRKYHSCVKTQYWAGSDTIQDSLCVRMAEKERDKLLAWDSVARPKKKIWDGLVGGT